MSGYNHCVFVGNLGQDAEHRVTQGGNSVCKFSIAVNEKWKDKDGNPKESTTWVPCELWGSRAEALSQYLTKGKQLLVAGKLKIDKIDGDDGKAKYFTKISVDDVQFVGGPRSEGQSTGGGSASPRHAPQQRSSAKPAPAADYDGFGGDDDEIPFAFATNGPSEPWW